jgi:hypothetical protein
MRARATGSTSRSTTSSTWRSASTTATSPSRCSFNQPALLRGRILSWLGADPAVSFRRSASAAARRSTRRGSPELENVAARLAETEDLIDQRFAALQDHQAQQRSNQAGQIAELAERIDFVERVIRRTAQAGLHRRTAGAGPHHTGVTPGTSLTYRLLARAGFGGCHSSLPSRRSSAPGWRDGWEGGKRHSATGPRTHRNTKLRSSGFTRPPWGGDSGPRHYRDHRLGTPDWQIVFTHFSPSAESSAAKQPADVHAYLPPDSAGLSVNAGTGRTPAKRAGVREARCLAELATRAASRGIPVLLAAATVRSRERPHRLAGRGCSPAPAFEAITRAGAIAKPMRDGCHSSASHATYHHHGRSTIRQRPRPSLPCRGREASAAARTTHKVLVAGSTWGHDEAVLLEAFSIARKRVAGARS